MNQNPIDSLRALANKWPSSIVARTEIRKFTGGLVSEKALANRDSLKTGPLGRIRIGKKICYPVDSIIQWLESQATRLD